MTPLPQDARATGLVELAVRCEQATGDDRELDREIELALPVYEDAKYLAFGIPAYTASLDAAMTLVPEGWRIWTADFSIEGRFVWMLKGPLAPWIDPEDRRECIAPQYVSGIAATPALALTAAALRALAASTKDMNHEG